MFNRTGQIRSRKARLRGEQLDITFPRVGRPSKHRVLERCGQMRLDLQRPTAMRETKCATAETTSGETFEQALDLTFPERPLTDDELTAEFTRLFG